MFVVTVICRLNRRFRKVRNGCDQDRTPVSYTHLDVYKRQQYKCLVLKYVWYKKQHVFKNEFKLLLLTKGVIGI